MSVRRASRTLTGEPAIDFEVVLGRRRDGRRGATLHPIKYRAVPIPLADAGQLRALIADLGEALAHLEGRS